jgi:hypothetical protein
MTSEVNDMRLKIGMQSDADAAARGEGAELPVPVRRSGGTLDGLIAGLTELKDAVARRPPTLRTDSGLDADGLVVPEERPFDPAKAAKARWKAMVVRNPTVVTKVRELAPHLQQRRQVERTRWERFCDAVRERPDWMEARRIVAGTLMMLFSIAFLAFAFREAGLL